MPNSTRLDIPQAEGVRLRPTFQSRKLQGAINTRRALAVRLESVALTSPGEMTIPAAHAQFADCAEAGVGDGEAASLMNLPRRGRAARAEAVGLRGVFEGRDNVLTH